MARGEETLEPEPLEDPRLTVPRDDEAPFPSPRVIDR
jgi:hypothetical protein